MKKIFIGLLAITSVTAYAEKSVYLDKQFTLKAQSVEAVDQYTKYSGIYVDDSINNDKWLLDDATNSAKKICKAFGHHSAIESETDDIRYKVLGVLTSKFGTCKLSYIDFDMWDLEEYGKFPIGRKFCDFHAGTDKTNFAFTTVTCE